jgi:cellulase/cellobiase CelA1
MTRTRWLAPLLALVIAVTGALTTAPAQADTTPPTPACPVAITYTLTAQWNTGYVAQFTIRNITSEPIGPGWTLSWTFTGGDVILSGWTGVWTQAGPNVTVTSSWWAPGIPPGGTVTVGFAASGPPSRPTNVRFNGIPCTLM